MVEEKTYKCKLCGRPIRHKGKCLPCNLKLKRERDSKMLDREVVKEFLQDELEEIKIPKNISFDKLVETFCKYTEGESENRNRLQVIGRPYGRLRKNPMV